MFPVTYPESLKANLNQLMDDLNDHHMMLVSKQFATELNKLEMELAAHISKSAWDAYTDLQVVLAKWHQRVGRLVLHDAIRHGIKLPTVDEAVVQAHAMVRCADLRNGEWERMSNEYKQAQNALLVQVNKRGNEIVQSYLMAMSSYYEAVQLELYQWGHVYGAELVGNGHIT